MLGWLLSPKYMLLNGKEKGKVNQLEVVNDKDQHNGCSYYNKAYISCNARRQLIMQGTKQQKGTCTTSDRNHCTPRASKTARKKPNDQQIEQVINITVLTSKQQ